MVAYADTSFLVSLYLLEETSDRAVTVARNLSEALPMNLLLLLEFRNALNLRRQRSNLTSKERDLVWKTFEGDISDGIFLPTPISMPEVCKKARELSDRLTPRWATRSLDLLHIASALIFEVKELYTFDERQARAARTVGLKVKPG